MPPTDDWLTTSWTTLGVIVVKAALTYGALVIFVRIAGLRSFSKLSSFDFAATVAFESVLASAVGAPDPPVAQVVFALGLLIALQTVVAAGRRWDAVARAVDNSPLLLMAGPEVLEYDLRTAQVTHLDLAAKLREAKRSSIGGRCAPRWWRPPVTSWSCTAIKMGLRWNRRSWPACAMPNGSTPHGSGEIRIRRNGDVLDRSTGG